MVEAIKLITFATMFAIYKVPFTDFILIMPHNTVEWFNIRAQTP